VRISLREFSEVFKLRSAAGRPYVLIGGQAVNYWAERYLKSEPELERLLPFTSEDIDFKWERQWGHLLSFKDLSRSRRMNRSHAGSRVCRSLIRFTPKPAAGHFNPAILPTTSESVHPP